MQDILAITGSGMFLFLPTRSTPVSFTRSQSYKAFIGLYLQIDGHFFTSLVATSIVKFMLVMLDS